MGNVFYDADLVHVYRRDLEIFDMADGTLGPFSDGFTAILSTVARKSEFRFISPKSMAQ